jgi:glycosyltransferase involved in cell wall biosynthesis
VHHKVDGILVDPKNIIQIANTIGEMIDKPEQRLTLGIAASRSVRNRLSISAQAKALTGVYSDLFVV